ncbi:hypothetical protein ACE2AJ_19675 [Aquihabitans daechungensis]|uniref:hypothetical protein n=1 Tax=Aquihabitans daechungensis TaxID=1052257 RepID=UPI003B9F64D1
MTDPTEPGRHEPVDTTADLADRAWLRTQLDPVVGAVPGDGWSAIAQRVDGAEAPSQRRRGRALRLAAAVVALIALAGAIALTVRDPSDDSTKVQTATPPPATASAETGWYAPVDLPSGWEVLQVLATPGGKTCELWGATWTQEGTAAVGVTFDTCAFPQNEKTRDPHWETTRLDGGILGTGPSMKPQYSNPTETRSEIRWDDDDGGYLVQASGVTPEQVVDIANALIADPDRDDLPVAGLELLERWENPEVANTPNVIVLLQAPSGKQADLRLSLPGHGRAPDGSLLVTPVEVSGQPLDVVRFDEPGPGSWSFRGLPGALAGRRRRARSPRPLRAGSGRLDHRRRPPGPDRRAPAPDHGGVAFLPCQLEGGHRGAERSGDAGRGGFRAPGRPDHQHDDHHVGHRGDDDHVDPRADPRGRPRFRRVGPWGVHAARRDVRALHADRGPRHPPRAGIGRDPGRVAGRRHAHHAQRDR